MNHELSAWTDRIDALERANRKWKRGLVGVAGGAIALALCGMAAPLVCNIVRAERVVVEDRGGNSRIVIDAYATDTPTIALNDKDGRALAKLGVTPDGQAFLDVFDKKGERRGSYHLGDDAAPKPDAKTESRPHAGKIDSATAAAE
jgi:hypothetical protein